MPKVKGPLHSHDAQGTIGKTITFRRGGIVTRYHKPTDRKTVAQLSARQAFRDMVAYMLTKEQADLLYSAILHNHNSSYAALGHVHEHSALYGLSGDDHPHYFNQQRGDSRYQQIGQGIDHGGLTGLADDDHAQYFDQVRGDNRWRKISTAIDHGTLTGMADDDHLQYYNQVRGDARYQQIGQGIDHGGLTGLADDDHAQYYNQVRGDARYRQLSAAIDHGTLTGNGDDDHSQYHNNARGDARYIVKDSEGMVNLGYTLLLADDTVRNITPPMNWGRMEIWGYPSKAQANYFFSGVFRIDTANCYLNEWVVGANVIVTSGPITISDAIDGKLTLSIVENTGVYVLNRLGSQRYFRVKVF